MKQWYFPIARVPQGDNHGCAIASVATVAGVTYQRARAEFFPRRKHFMDNKSLCVTQDRMIHVLARLGFKARLACSFEKTRVPALVAFSWAPTMAYSGIHCVVWNPFSESKKVIDPGLDHDYGRSDEYYANLWKRSNFKVVLVTGRKRT